jgi:squalene-hopene/tetraprenyl-beta-curcumene cyclase
MKIAYKILCPSAVCLVVGFLSACSHSQAKAGDVWNPVAAATYLEQREVWWAGWKMATRDHETFCVSCHTVLPYALAQTSFHEIFEDETPSASERRLLGNVTKRVRLWNEVAPYYTDQEYGTGTVSRSRGTEAVLNALILASHDARQGQLSDDSRTAFNNMWALQVTAGERKGAWPWLQFGLRPCAARDSQYFGAALAALAVGLAPGNYRSTPEIQDNLKLLREYLEREYSRQSLFSRSVLLWASTKWPGLVDPEKQKSAIDEILGEQKEDGGWSLSSLERFWKGSSLRDYVRSWIREDGTLVETKSDGYATGLLTYVLQQAGTSQDNVQLKRGLNWLVHNQNKTEGWWLGYSLNERRNPSSNIGRFMNDAATAYAFLALTEAKHHREGYHGQNARTD